MTEKTKKNVQRSASYPSIDLKESIDYAKEIDESFGPSQFDRTNAVQAMGYDKINGTSAVKFAALQKYGLVDRQGNAYICSELLRKILRPSDQSQKPQAIREAVNKPKLFKSLISTYKTKALPKLLNNILVSEHGITSKASTSVVGIFTKSIKFAGLYLNGVVFDLDEVKVQAEAKTRTPKLPVQESGILEEKNTPSNSLPTSYLAQKDYDILDLPSGIKLSYPKKLAFYITTELGSQIKAFDEEITKLKRKISDDNTPA